MGRRKYGNTLFYGWLQIQRAAFLIAAANTAPALFPREQQVQKPPHTMSMREVADQNGISKQSQ